MLSKWVIIKHLINGIRSKSISFLYTPTGAAYHCRYCTNYTNSKGPLEPCLMWTITQNCTSGSVTMKDPIAIRYCIAWSLHFLVFASFLKMIFFGRWNWAVHWLVENDHILLAFRFRHSFKLFLNIWKWNNVSGKHFFFIKW